jgi:hypothetical protein
MKMMSKQAQPDLIEHAHRLDFAAAVRREQVQALLQLVNVNAIPLWLLVLNWMAIAALLLAGCVFVSWLAWHH